MTQRRVRDGLYGYGLLVVILACMAACSRSSEVPIRQATEGITLKSKPSLQGVDLLLLIDESEKFLTTLQPTNPAHFLASRFAEAAHQRVSQEMVDDDLYVKELRRVNVELVIPLTNWTHYEETLAHYQEYHRVPTNTLVHIYPEEQDAFRLERLIAQKIDRTFAGHILDQSVTALLGNYALFEKFALILTEGLLSVAGGGLGEPLRYILTLPNGNVDMEEI